jgi:hypothetical protein
VEVGDLIERLDEIADTDGALAMLIKELKK